MVGDLSIYFDESCSHPPAPRVYTVGGYLSTNVQWKKFRKEWRKILEAENIDHFHMVDFQSCDPPYKYWSKEKRIEFLSSLHAIIHKRTLMSFATTANLDAWDALPDEQKHSLVSPHVFAAKNCMKQVGFWTAEKLLHYPIIEYIFEEGQPHERQLKRSVDSFTDEDKSFFRIASLKFAKKKGFTGENRLQSADIVAYESMKEIARQIDPFNTRSARLSGVNLARDKERNQWFYCVEYDFIKSINDAERRAKEYADRHSR